MATTEILAERRDSLLILTLHRPDRKNALTLSMYEALVEELQAARTDPAVRVVVLRGSHGVFTSGNDLMDFMQNPPSGAESPVFRFLLTLVDYEKPIIAAVEGFAVGIGTTLLLHCDLVYAAENAQFRLPFVNLALVPEAGSSFILPRMMGHAKAAELLLLGDKFDAATAATLGIVNSVVPTATVYEYAEAKARALASKAPEALRLSKRLMKQYDREQLKQIMAEEAVLFASRLGSPETNEAIQAFFEKREPDFSRFS